MLVMFTTLIVGATFPLVFSGLIVEKIPFTVLNLALYLYLFLTISGSFSIKLGFLADHTGLVVLLAAGALVLLVLLGRIFWERLAKLREQLVAGGAILRDPRRTATRLFLPALGSYAARLAIVAVFLGAYSIPVSFQNVATVTASNSVSNSVSATPGGVGVTQAMNSAALAGSTYGQDRDRLLDRPAADRLRLGRDLRDPPRLLGLRLDRRQAAGRGLIRRGQGT